MNKRPLDPRSGFSNEEAREFIKDVRHTDRIVPRFKAVVSESGQITLGNAPDQAPWIALVPMTYGVRDHQVGSHLMEQTIRSAYCSNSLGADGTERATNGTVGLVAGIGPQDTIEAMLASQMAGIHNATMECLERAARPGQPSEFRQANLNQANKLSRTFTAQMEALNKHRGKGQQKVTVEHVHVHEGGQAIVGHVEGGAGVLQKFGGTSPCTATRCLCTGHPDAERGPGAGVCAGRQRWRGRHDAGCTAAPQVAVPSRETRTLSGTAGTPPPPSQSGGTSVSYCERRARP